MNNIIQLVVQKVKREIEENLIKVIEGSTEANLKGNILEKTADVSYQKAAELSMPIV